MQLHMISNCLYLCYCHQHVFEAVKSESCEVCGKPSEVLAHQLNLKHSVSSTILDALDSVERIVITMVSGAMTSDESTFKLGRFPHFIEVLYNIVHLIPYYLLCFILYQSPILIS